MTLDRAWTIIFAALLLFSLGTTFLYRSYTFTFRDLAIEATTLAEDWKARAAICEGKT